MSARREPPRYHAPVWSEKLIMEMGAPGRRGQHVPPAEDAVRAVGAAGALLPKSAQRKTRPALPEMSEPDVLRHYLHLSQQTMGMVGVSLFGTCTMKYNPRAGEALAARPEIAELHPDQPAETMQGALEALDRMAKLLSKLSGMERFTFQAAGGADAAYLFACLARAYFLDRGELSTRDEIVTSLQSHPCNPATAASAGFKVVTLPLGPKGYPELAALKAAVGPRTAALMINNPDDMGLYNPEIREWVRIVHEAGALAFYDHANFNGVMGKIRAADLGFDACMFMLHKTFGVSKGGGGPAVGAFGCRERLADFLPGPLVEEKNGVYGINPGSPRSLGRVREHFGNVQQVLKALYWTRAMGEEGIHEASDISVLLNNYMEKRLLRIRGVARSHPSIGGWRLEMTRYSLGPLFEETGVSAVDVQNRMTDFGVDAFWLSHEPWLFPQPFTPEAGEMWSREDVDLWIDVLAYVCAEAYDDPQIVKTAPHNQAIAKLDGARLDEPDFWATTYAAYRRKHPKGFSRAG